MTRKGGGAVCRPGRGGQQLKEGRVRETGWAITGAQNALKPRTDAAEAGAAGLSRRGQAPLPAWLGSSTPAGASGWSPEPVQTCRVRWEHFSNRGSNLRS